jgi:hypothetical protein
MELTCEIESAANGERELSPREHVTTFLTSLYSPDDVFEIRAKGIGDNKFVVGRHPRICC